jgi:hypothetical protein
MSAKISDPTVKWLRRVARLLTFLILAFALVMLVGHIVEPEPVEADYPPIENLLPIIMGLSVLGLGIALRWEALGATISLVFFVAHLALFWAIRGSFFPLNILVVFAPLPFAAILFLICWWRSRPPQLTSRA